MEKRTLSERSELVRCLDCGTEYLLPRDVRGEAKPCPVCGAVGWVAARTNDGPRKRTS
jgi:hypothetical protein